jgi:hypothetical protein
MSSKKWHLTMQNRGCAVNWLKIIIYLLTSKPCPLCSKDPAHTDSCPLCGGEGVVPGRHREPAEVKA